MAIAQSFSSGFRRASSEPKMILVVYVINLLLAIPFALAFRSVLSAGFASSMAPAEMMQGINFTVFMDFMNAHSEALGAVVRQASWLLLLSMLLQTFLAGGILTILQDQERKFSATVFFKGCGTYFLRFFRLFLFFGFVLLVVSLIVGFILIVVTSSMGANLTSEVTYFRVMLGALAVFLLPVTLLLMSADYARIHIVLHDEPSAIRSAGKAMVFVVRRFFSTFGLELLMLCVPMALYALYVMLDLAIGMTSGATIVLMFLIQQLFMVLRSWTKVFFYGGELSLYKALQRVPFSEIDAPIAPAGSGKSVLV